MYSPNGSSTKKEVIGIMRESLALFNETELGKNLSTILNEHSLPFKYKTIGYVKKILASPEVEEDAKDFRMKEWRLKQWLYTEQIDKDIVRTKHLKDNSKLHDDVKRVLEYYCHTKNVAYC
jgi:hypothetical protein